MRRRGALSLGEYADEVESDPEFERMVSLQERALQKGSRLECLKLAVSAKAYGEPGDPVSLAKRFADFVLGELAG